MTTLSGSSATRWMFQLVLAIVLLPAACAWAQSPATEAAKDAPIGKLQHLVVYRLRSANAAIAAKVLKSVFVSSNPTKDTTAPTIVVDDRTNSILISGTAEQVLEAEQLLLKLDSTDEVDGNVVIEKRLDQLEQQLQTLLSDLKSLRQQLKPATQPGGKDNRGAISR